MIAARDSQETRLIPEPTLLLLPGWESDPDRVQGLMQQLARRFRVLTTGCEPQEANSPGGTRLVEQSRAAIERSRASAVIVAALDHDFLVVQQGFARSHRWFQVELLESGSHFPALERPHAIAHAIDRFASANS